MVTTIRVHESTYTRLARHGDLSSSFDRTIQKLLDIVEGVAASTKDSEARA